MAKWKKITLLVILIAYWLLPTDVIPDIIAGVGQVDDILVTLLTVLPLILKAKGSSEVVEAPKKLEQ